MPMPLLFAPMIETRRLWIRPMRRTDVAALMPVNGNPEAVRFMPQPAWTTLADGDAWMNGMLAQQERGDSFSFVISRRIDGSIIGSCFVFHQVPESARAEIGYGLSPAHWGRGYALEAMHALIPRIFTSLRLRRIEAEVDPRNAPSIGLLERLGFVQEGLLRERWNIRDEVADARLYGLLQKDWLARHHGFSGHSLLPAAKAPSFPAPRHGCADIRSMQGAA
jgi:[ribosomal protein S5]-alanine N-acetyltransferase